MACQPEPTVADSRRVSGSARALRENPEFNPFRRFFQVLPLLRASRCRPRQTRLPGAAHKVFHNIVPIGKGKHVIALW